MELLDGLNMLISSFWLRISVRSKRLRWVGGMSSGEVASAKRMRLFFDWILLM